MRKQKICRVSTLLQRCFYNGCRMLGNEAGIIKCRHQCQAGAHSVHACVSVCNHMKSLNPNACGGDCPDKHTHFLPPRNGRDPHHCAQE